MKKIMFLVIALIAVSTTVWATPVWFDADGAGATYDAILIDEVNGNSALTNIVQTFGNDGVLNSGDLSYEDLVLNLFYAYDTSSVYNYFKDANVYATVNNLVGEVVDFSGATVDDSMQGQTLIDAMSATSYGVSFIENPVQTVSLTQDGGLIGNFSLLRGGTDAFVTDLNSSATSQFGIDLITDALTAGYFFQDNAGVQGEDWSTLLANNAGSLFFLAIADSSVETMYLFNEFTDDNMFMIGVKDNGTGVTFSAVPEPATFLLLGGGLMGLGFYARRRKK